MPNKDEKIPTSVVILKMQLKKQQGFTVQCRELYAISFETIIEKNQKNKRRIQIYTYICITESLRCTPETNTIL